MWILDSIICLVEKAIIFSWSTEIMKWKKNRNSFSLLIEYFSYVCVICLFGCLGASTPMADLGVLNFVYPDVTRIGIFRQMSDIVQTFFVPLWSKAYPRNFSFLEKILGPSAGFWTYDIGCRKLFKLTTAQLISKNCI